MFRLNRDFGIAVLCVLPFIVGCMIICLYRANPMFAKLQSQLDGVNAILQEDISGIRIIKACVKEGLEKKRFGEANDSLTGIQLAVLIIFAFMDPVVNALMYLVVAVILLIGSREIGGGLVTPGTIMAAITYTTQLLSGIHMLTMLFQNISRGYVSWKRVKEVLLTEPEQKNGTFEGRTEKSGEIEFREVSFAYPGSNRIVLKELSFSIHKGETVAIMGATGSGKTTLVNLIPRFYDAGCGMVLVDGRDVREYDMRVLRSKIAVVSQKTELFALSVKDNLRWGEPDADEKSVKSAAAIAQADEFISKLPGGYNTMVAERGSSLSGGQKQRISIARAVLKSAEILIFDDATSALDLRTEKNLYDALQKENPESTKIIVAQRIASVRHADRIILLEKGRISAVGTHEELMNMSPVYQDIYSSQMAEGAA
ncbi:MAG: ABC transporter ATP-binding protein/permease [Clostridiales bacterium]|nr:ABC transporter ATP-binding protein/permease [Clostridiales bacterium]